MKIRVVAALVMGALTAQAQAAGFQLAEYSATGLGRAYAGEAAMADNASSQARNPALLMQLEGQQLSAGLIYVDPNIDTTGTVSREIRLPNGGVMPVGSSSGNAEDFAPAALIPNFYYSNKLNDKWAFGVAFNASHGMTTELPATHAAAVFGSDVGIEVMELAPAVAYQLTDSLVVGASVRALYGKGHVTATASDWLPTLNPDVPAGATLKSVDGDGFDVGYQLGATWQPSADRRIGFSYRSEVDLTLEGEAEGLSFGLLPGQSKDGELVLPLPATAELAGFHQLTDKLAMHASVNWTNWSAFESLTVDFPDGSSDLLKEENFEDNWRYALGATYSVNNEMTLRAGVALDKGAVSDEHRTLSIPDSDRLWFSTGLGYRFSKNFDIDFALTYIKASEASINESLLLDEDASLYARYQGEISGDVWLVGTQLNYRF